MGTIETGDRRSRAGQTVELALSLRESDDDSTTIALAARAAGKRMASAAFEFRAGGRS